jgi:hypothetical protein
MANITVTHEYEIVVITDGNQDEKISLLDCFGQIGLFIIGMLYFVYMNY